MRAVRGGLAVLAVVVVIGCGPRCPDGYVVTPNRTVTFDFTLTSEGTSYAARGNSGPTTSPFALAYQEPESSGRGTTLELDRTLLVDVPVPGACALTASCAPCDRQLSLQLFFRSVDPADGPRTIALAGSNVEVLLRRHGVVGNVCPIGGPNSTDLAPLAFVVQSGELAIDKLRTTCGSISQLRCALETSGNFRFSSAAATGERLDVSAGQFAASDSRVFEKDRFCD